MANRLVLLGFAAVLVSSAGCSKDDDASYPPSPPVGSIDLTVSATSVLANGTNTVEVAVSDSGGGPITVTTTRGSFTSGGLSATLTQSGALTLVTCSAATQGCAGSAVLTATGPSGTDQAMVTFGTLSSVCPTDCSADAGCRGYVCNRAGGAQGTCSNTTPSTCVVAAACVPSGSTEAVCSDGLDNDCDGEIDCLDSDCQARGGNLGKVCNTSLSLLCSAPDANGDAACTYCKGQQTVEATCIDQDDNDCDGAIDCEDSDCSGGSCGIAGRTCNAVTLLCSCPGGLTAETSCQDGNDEDCDGAADCADTDCQLAGGLSCGANGLRCDPDEGVCACPGSVEVCSASGDEDCDGASGCEDSDCRPAGNAFGAICDPAGHTCSPPAIATGVSTCTVCPGGETAESSCFDGKDNDCDGRADCQDPDCTGDPCSATGHTCNAQLMCSCAGGQAAEATCGDSLDNDCDGKRDCADTDCTGVACGTNGFACAAGACACSGNGGVAQASELACADGADNDCDSFVDCGDVTCQPVGNALGRVCSAAGMTCSVNLGAGSTCTVCSGNGGRPELAEETCGDGFDNDCDGIIDCQDPDCANLACNTAGKTCTAASRLCACNSTEASGEATCDDGSDNDCDGKIDCADEDCAADQCGANGLACAGATCACGGNGGFPEASESRCGDGHDNDCDGGLDCADPGCRPAAGVTYGLSCDTTGTAGMRCNASSICVCSGNGGAPEATESSCADGSDNDCDGAADCADTDCRPAAPLAGKACDTRGNTCSTSGTCTVCSGNGGTVEVAEATCGDTRDNDCDGKTDCADDQCAARACDPGDATKSCLPVGSPGVLSCTDPTFRYSVAVGATRTRIPADGINTSDVTATFTKDGVAIPSATCTFGPAARFPVPNTARTNAAGQATLRFTSSAAGGTANVTASCTDGVVTVAGSLAIDQPLLGVVRLQNQEYAVMGARASGFQEKSMLTFELLDSTGQTYPEGLAVTFSHESQGGSFLGPRSNCTAAVPSVCTESGVTDASGKVQVLLTSGRKFSLLAVTATATAGNISGSAPAGNIAVVGAKASGARISVDCELDNVPALMDHDCTSSFVDTKVTCTASLADRHGIVLGFPTVVGFKSEAGAAGVPGLTALYDGTPSGTANLGYATSGIAVYGHALPVDVTPFTGEHSLDYVGACGMRTYNPRDGVSTVIAMANGEEGFVDLDSDGEYDAPDVAAGFAGEPFIDMGEPYVDVNDNGVRDADEWFEDTNLNRSYDGPNGVFDEDTVIWAQTRVVYTGFPMVYVNPNPAVPGTIEDLGSRWYDLGDAGDLPGATVRPTYSVAIGPPITSEVFGFLFVDENFNPVTSSTTFETKSFSTKASADFYFEPFIADSLGVSYRLLYCDDPVPGPTTTCSGGTPEQACTTSPCYIVPDVGLCDGVTPCKGFQYGTGGSVIITAGQDLGASAVGVSTVIQGGKSTVFIEGVTTP